MNKLGIIIQREYLSRVRKKSFLIMTLLTPFLMVALVAIPLLLTQVKGNKVNQVAVYDESGQYVSRLTDSKNYLFIPLQQPVTELSAERRGDYYAYLSIAGCLIDSTAEVKFYSKKQIPMDLKELVENQLESIAADDKIASYHIEGLAQILKEARPDVRTESVLWSDKDQDKEVKTSSELSMIIGMIATMLIYIFIFVYGSMVMNGVVEEKSNRIVEIIVSSVKPFQLMMGKIIGIALVGITQFTLWVVLIGILAAIGTPLLGISPDMSQEVLAGTMNVPAEVDLDSRTLDLIQTLGSFHWGQILFWFLLFFLGGYLLYASIFAAVGGAVDNQEDSQQFVLPITMLVIFALYVGIYGVMNPDGPMLLWCSFIPFFSPIVMMVRLPFGVPGWQLWLSFLLLVATFLLIVKLAARIYRTGILMYGKKVTYKDLWKWLRYRS